jgi:ubiquinone/menaquinone biosynthesis C-methylase UbiE
MPDEPLLATQRFFDNKADAYRASKSHANEAELARMIAWLGRERGRALDVATGGGHTARALRDAGFDVVSHDATRSMAPDVLSDALALPFKRESFDLVASRIAPHHFPDIKKFCREVSRILKPGGKLYVFDLTTPLVKAQAEQIDAVERLRDPSHGHSWSPGEWRVALTGWKTDRMETTQSEMDLEPWIARAQMPPEREAELRGILAARPNLSGYGLTQEGKMRVLRVELLARK